MEVIGNPAGCRTPGLSQALRATAASPATWAPAAHGAQPRSECCSPLQGYFGAADVVQHSSSYWMFLPPQGTGFLVTLDRVTASSAQVTSLAAYHHCCPVHAHSPVLSFPSHFPGANPRSCSSAHKCVLHLLQLLLLLLAYSPLTERSQNSKIKAEQEIGSHPAHPSCWAVRPAELTWTASALSSALLEPSTRDMLEEAAMSIHTVLLFLKDQCYYQPFGHGRRENT